MKRFLFLLVLMFSLSLVSCNRTWVCECGDTANVFEEEGRYDNEKEAQSGCYTTEVNLQQNNPSINCLVREL